MTGGSNMERNSLVYKIEDFYQTFEVYKNESSTRFKYRVSLLILGILFFVGLAMTIISLREFKIYALFLLITLFFEIFFLILLSKYRSYIEAEKIKKIKEEYKCSHEDLSALKEMWIRKSFPSSNFCALQIISDIDNLVETGKRYNLNETDFKNSIFSFVYNSESKNRILALVVLLITVVSLSLTQLLIIQYPPDFETVINLLFSLEYGAVLITILILTSMLLGFIRQSKPAIRKIIEWFFNLDYEYIFKLYINPSIRNFILRTVSLKIRTWIKEKFKFKTQRSQKKLKISEYKSRFLIEYLIQIAPAHTKTNN